jgi:hypothetical protein
MVVDGGGEDSMIQFWLKRGVDGLMKDEAEATRSYWFYGK